MLTAFLFRMLLGARQLCNFHTFIVFHIYLTFLFIMQLIKYQGHLAVIKYFLKVKSFYEILSYVAVPSVRIKYCNPSINFIDLYKSRTLALIPCYACAVSI